MKLSVVIVTYNQKDTIEEAVESALAQDTPFPFEIIVADDGSSDGTPEVLVAMQERVGTHKLRLLLHKENFGDKAMTNTQSAIHAATGEYTAFLDGDDYWTDTRKLAKQVAFLDRHPDCVYCGHRVYHDSGSARSLSPCPARGASVQERSRLLVQNFTPRVSVVARTHAVQNMPDWYTSAGAISADWLMHVLLTREGKIGFLSDIMAVHRVHEASISNIIGLQFMMEDKRRLLTLLAPLFPDDAASFRNADRDLALRVGLNRASPRLFNFVRGSIRTLRRLRNQTRRPSANVQT